MLNFTFKNQTEILFGKGQIKEAKSRLPQDARVLLLYGGGSIKRNGVYD
ncbi:MAG TPA: NADH-dependent alcohol dehydrogenase, partial [Rheinheimera sp.]|nr:NADH-dependent alcohol dehydrogenase [Rheinheimera sp.]